MSSLRTLYWAPDPKDFLWSFYLRLVSFYIEVCDPFWVNFCTNMRCQRSFIFVCFFLLISIQLFQHQLWKSLSFCWIALAPSSKISGLIAHMNHATSIVNCEIFDNLERSHYTLMNHAQDLMVLMSTEHLAQIPPKYSFYLNRKTWERMPVFFFPGPMLGCLSLTL